ncbi:MAG: hypothetical protein JWO38_4990 [Gemmataceae bacterium]|nr:hypothetical protein [Gemmataceae bacterium]
MAMPTSPPTPAVDPVIVPDLTTEPHPGTEPVSGGVGPIPAPLPGLGTDPEIVDGFKQLPEMAKPEETEPLE